jgi:hypothetical protein
MTRANEQQRVSHASGAGHAGVPASEREGGSGGAKPPGKKIDVSDPKSGTAEFKACAVRVERAGVGELAPEGAR